MEKELSSYLRENEKVLWQGKTDTFPLLDQVTKFKTLVKWIVTAAVTAGLLALYMTKNEERSIGFIGLVLVVAVTLAAAPIMERRSLLGQKYWITDQRAIMMSRDKTFYYMDLAQIDDFKVVKDQAASVCLALGSDVFGDAEKQLRWRACHPKIDLQGQGPQDNVTGMIFYCVGNAEGAAAVLRQRGAKAA